MDKIKFTKEEKEILHRVMQNTWQYIGYDVLQLEGGGAVSRAIVMESIIDADRLRDQAKSEDEKKVVDKFYSLKNYDAMKRIAVKAFPFTRYGL